MKTREEITGAIEAIKLQIGICLEQGMSPQEIGVLSASAASLAWTLDDPESQHPYLQEGIKLLDDTIVACRVIIDKVNASKN